MHALICCLSAIAHCEANRRVTSEAVWPWEKNRKQAVRLSRCIRTETQLPLPLNPQPIAAIDALALIIAWSRRRGEHEACEFDARTDLSQHLRIRFRGQVRYEDEVVSVDWAFVFARVWNAAVLF